MHEGADRHRGYRRTASQGATYLRKGTLDVINRQGRLAPCITMQVPWRIVQREDIELLVESGSANTASPDIEAKDLHELRIFGSRDRRTYCA